MKFDSLEDKMLYYRNLSDYRVIPNLPVLVMVDGRSFSKLIKKRFTYPFDENFISIMNDVALYLCCQIPGCQLGYVQSDEISLFISDYSTVDTDSFFGYRLCKLQSIIASLATSRFNQLYTLHLIKDCKDIDECKSIISSMKVAQFDCKVWNVPTVNDAYAWFLYRQNDCVRNSILQWSQSYLPHREMENLKTSELLTKISSTLGFNWDDLSNDKKYGRVISKRLVNIQTPTGETIKRLKFQILNSELFSNKEYFGTLIGFKSNGNEKYCD